MAAPAPPPVLAPPEFKADKTMGVIIMVVAGISALSGLLSICAGLILGPIEQSVNHMAMQPPAKGSNYIVQDGHIQMFPTFHFASRAGIVGWIVLGIAVLQFVSGMWVHGSCRRGLIFALVIAVLSVFGGIFEIATGVVTGIYVVRRLWGNVGPRPV